MLLKTHQIYWHAVPYHTQVSGDASAIFDTVFVTGVIRQLPEDSHEGWVSGSWIQESDSKIHQSRARQSCNVPGTVPRGKSQASHGVFECFLSHEFPYGSIGYLLEHIWSIFCFRHSLIYYIYIYTLYTHIYIYIHRYWYVGKSLPDKWAFHVSRGRKFDGSAFQKWILPSPRCTWQQGTRLTHPGHVLEWYRKG